MNLESKERPRIEADLRAISCLSVIINNLTTDSRRIKPGDTFLAYAGQKYDARQFISEAIAAGANAVLWERHGFAWNPAWKIPNLPITQLRVKAGLLASYIYDYPSKQLNLIGITGTNGKTSCSHWIAETLTALGKKTAVIGTLGDGFLGTLQPSSNTTPDPILLQQKIVDYLKLGAKYVAMEVSSHGIEQGRIHGSTFTTALLTNLSHDHLDYHGSMEAYAKIKARLFKWPGLKCAVLNLDEKFGETLLKKLIDKDVKVVGYGFKKTKIKNLNFKKFRLVCGHNLKVSNHGLEFDVEFGTECVKFETRLLGRFNASNLLAVLATLLTNEIKLTDAVLALQQVHPVMGRMQRLGGGNHPVVIVDYAHTPDALERVLMTLREISLSLDPLLKTKTQDSKLICVFGCGGERDKSKRPLMGGVATRLADRVIVTSDNPRGENPFTIIHEILEGVYKDNYYVEADRASAIYLAIQGACKDDVVLVAGKGHEEYQEISGQKHPFNDVKLVQQILQSSIIGVKV